jgi:hypothetical protein
MTDEIIENTSANECFVCYEEEHPERPLYPPYLLRYLVTAEQIMPYLSHANTSRSKYFH